MAKRRAPSGPTQSTSEAELNEMNAFMRSQPWYQDWFRSQGLDPNKVKLNSNQRNALTNIAAQQGLILGDRMKFDEAGNLNQKGGWAGMSPRMKAIIGGGAIAGSMLIPGVGPAVLNGLKGTLSFGGGGGGSLGTGSGINAARNFASTQIPQAVGGSAGKGASMGFGGAIKDFFLGGNGKRGLDPTALTLGGLSLLGGDEDELNSFADTSADPVKRMTEALDAIKAMSNQLTQREPFKLRSSMPKGPEPVDIPGLGFQIGGGLGMDPALKAILGEQEGQESGPTQFPDLFGGPGSAQPRSFMDLFNSRNR